MRKILCILGGLIVFSAPAAALTPDQRDLLHIAKYYGDFIGHGETIQAMLLQESNATPPKKKTGSLGIMQVNLTTAEFVLDYYKLEKPKKKELKSLLIYNHDYNILVSVYYFKYLLELFNDYSKAVVAYNKGPTGIKNIVINKDEYLSGILSKLHHIVRPFNLNYENSICTTT